LDTGTTPNNNYTHTHTIPASTHTHQHPHLAPPPSAPPQQAATTVDYRPGAQKAEGMKGLAKMSQSQARTQHSTRTAAHCSFVRVYRVARGCGEREWDVKRVPSSLCAVPCRGILPARWGGGGGRHPQKGGGGG